MNKNISTKNKNIKSKLDTLPCATICKACNINYNKCKHLV